MARERMSSVDTAWLRMDAPSNLMMIVGIQVFESPVGLEPLRALLRERLLVHRRFVQRVERDAGGASWVDDDAFDLDRHLVEHRLPKPGGDVELQRYVAELAAQPLDPARPLWQFTLVRGYRGTEALVARIHHCIGDGIALVAVLLSLTDNAPPVAPASRGAPRETASDERNPWEAMLAPLTRGTVRTIESAGMAVSKSLGVLAEPDRLGDYAAVGSQVVRDALRIALMASDSATRLKGRPGRGKAIAWNEPLPLDEVKAVARAVGASVNDVLLSCVAGALRRYLLAHGDPVEGTEVRAMVPVNLRPASQALELGNRFGLVPLELPVGIASPVARLFEVRRRMDELKGGYQALLAYVLLGAVGMTPHPVQQQVLDVLARKATAVMTNVPGPTEPIRMAGRTLTRIMFWVPQSGDIGIGVSILSYAGGVQFGVISDTGLCPDPQRIIDGFAQEFERLVLTLSMLPPETFSGGEPDAAELERLLFGARADRSPAT